MRSVEARRKVSGWRPRAPPSPGLSPINPMGEENSTTPRHPAARVTLPRAVCGGGPGRGVPADAAPCPIVEPGPQPWSSAQEDGCRRRSLVGKHPAGARERPPLPASPHNPHRGEENSTTPRHPAARVTLPRAVCGGGPGRGAPADAARCPSSSPDQPRQVTAFSPLDRMWREWRSSRTLVEQKQDNRRAGAGGFSEDDTRRPRARGRRSALPHTAAG
jgi:hypothetical protein